MQLRIWPILLVGFAALIALVGLSGWLAYRRSQTTYVRVSTLNEDDRQVQQCLTQIQSNINSSAILLRDFLLDSGRNSSAVRAEMEKYRVSSETVLARLGHLLPPPELPQCTRLRDQIAQYWAAIDPLLAPRSAPRTLAGYALVQSGIAPHRHAALAVLNDIQTLSASSSQARKRQVDDRNSGMVFFFGKMLGITLVIALLIAFGSVLYLRSLEISISRHHSDLQVAQDSLRRLSQELVQAQEEERRTLSRDLHDQVGQILTALRMSLGNLEQSLPLPGEHTRQELDLAKRLAAQALRSTRDLAMGLRPTMLDDLGLQAALEWNAREHAKVYGTPVTVQVECTLPPLPEEWSTCIYRIVQEALTNAAKHAAARHIKVTLALAGSLVILSVVDDGIGFDLNISQTRGLGLLGMRERLTRLGGSLKVESQPGSGTRLFAQLPLPIGSK